MKHRNATMTDELEAIYRQTVEFVAREVQPHGLAWEEEGKVPREVLQRMGGLGMLGLRVPEALGGLGLGPVASAAFSEALGSSTFAGFDVTVLVHTDMAGPHKTCFPKSMWGGQILRRSTGWPFSRCESMISSTSLSST